MENSNLLERFKTSMQAAEKKETPPANPVFNEALNTVSGLKTKIKERVAELGGNLPDASLDKMSRDAVGQKEKRDHLQTMGERLDRWGNYFQKFEEVNETYEEIKDAEDGSLHALKVATTTSGETQNTAVFEEAHAKTIDMRRSFEKNSLPQRLVNETPEFSKTEDYYGPEYLEAEEKWLRLTREQQQRFNREREERKNPELKQLRKENTELKAQLVAEKARADAAEQKNRQLEIAAVEKDRLNRELANKIEQQNAEIEQLKQESARKDREKAELQRQFDEAQEAIRRLLNNTPITDEEIAGMKDETSREVYKIFKEKDDQIKNLAKSNAELEEKNQQFGREVREIQGLFHERNIRPLTAAEIVRLTDEGWINEDELTPSEKRVLANAGIRDMTSSERLQVGRDDIGNFLENNASRFASFIDNHAEIFGAAAGLVGAAGLRAFLVYEGFDVQAADLFARTAAIPVGALRLAVMPLVERVRAVSDVERDHPTATRRIRALANAVTTGVLGWAGESLISPATPHFESPVSNTNSSGQSQSKVPSQVSGEPGLRGSPLGTEMHLPNQVPLHDSIWRTIETGINNWVPDADKLSPFGHQYLTDAMKDVVNQQFSDPAHARGIISMSADVQHQIGQHLSKALDTNIANRSFEQHGGRPEDIQKLRSMAEFFLKAK